MLDLKFNLTAEEYYSFNYYTTWSAPGRKQYRLFYYGRIILLYAAVALLYIFSKGTDQWMTDLIIFLCIGLVYFFLLPLLVKRSIRNRVKQVLKKEENQHILQESQVVISKDGVLDRDTVSESRYDWEAIVKKAETSDSFYLYTNSYHAIVIPKRTLNKDQVHELNLLLEQHLPLSSEV